MSGAEIEKKKLSPLDEAMRPLLRQEANLASLLPKGMSTARFLMQMRRALFTTPALQLCSPATLIGAMIEAADLGLDPSGRLGSAYLIPYKGVVKLIPGYRGLVDLAHRSGFVKSINAWVVHEKDIFRSAAGEVPTHVPYVPKRDEPQDPGPWYAVWARAVMHNGVSECEVMTYREVMAIKSRSPGARQKGGPWETDEEQMAAKTVIRRLAKKLPLSPTIENDRFARALEVDGATITVPNPENPKDRIVEEPTDAEFSEMPADPDAPPPESQVDSMKNKL